MSKALDEFKGYSVGGDDTKDSLLEILNATQNVISITCLDI